MYKIKFDFFLLIYLVSIQILDQIEEPLKRKEKNFLPYIFSRSFYLKELYFVDLS